MLKFKIESEPHVLGYDPKTELAIEAKRYFVVATDEAGKQRRHASSFSTKFEVINLVGEVAYQANRQARHMAQHLIDEFKSKGLASIAGHTDWNEH